MKTEYTIKLRCATCGCEDKFEFNEDKSYVKCTFCDREYFGGIQELQESNQDLIEDVKDEIKEDAMQHISDMLKNAFKGNKHIKIK